MVTFELVEFVKEHLEKGTPKEHISEMLSTRGGWVQEDIDHALFLAEYGHRTSVDDDLIE